MASRGEPRSSISAGVPGTRSNALISKEHNRKLLLRHILNTSVSRIEIASLTGLTRAGAGVIVDSLIKDGFLEEELTKKPGKGRSPKALYIRDTALYAVGINITRSGSSAGICGLNGKIICAKSFPVKHSREETIDLIHNEVKKMLKGLKINPRSVAGAGITTPGPVDSIKGVILKPPDFNHWEFYPIAEIFEEKLGIPAYLENNSIARTIEEQYYGVGKLYEDFINLVVDNGIGGGIVVNMKLIKGVGGCGSELGHITINSQGKRCYCGNPGCLEMYANPKAFVTEAVKAGYKIKSWDEIALRAEAGEAYFKNMVKRMAFYIASGCTSLINLFEPQVIIISGELNQHNTTLIKYIQDEVNKSRINRDVREVAILSSDTDKSQGVMAAATLVFSCYLSSPIR
ncbi:ROK family protein [Leadbettera azotonutricia]|uniref:Putative ROK n=1 Tax=Leadbettera azotonutricia (strain ATCC BAA-888 / DSM 13862 / ZAS-9) TaxID=545695 RepID=F5Y7X5_LEAAZ|nr:ROK family protein [Leadbettera azotonutricia]AEF81199.1 putative ROK [Leadbettera azotonutricia ZAS-9]